MKIELELPDWAIGRNITIFAGKELLAYSSFVYKKKPFFKGYPELKIKEGRCNGCGTCCEQYGSPFTREQYNEIIFRLDTTEFKEMGRCPLLGDKGCILGDNIPFDCARSDCSRMKNCTEQFIELEIE